MKCNICDEECETVDEYNSTCDLCWYGMRMRPDEWLQEMKDKGIEIEHGMGCQPISDAGIICGDPYQRKI